MHSLRLCLHHKHISVDSLSLNLMFDFILPRFHYALFCVCSLFYHDCLNTSMMVLFN